MENLSVQPDILISLERAWEEGTLDMYIADYVEYTGSIKNIYNAVKKSSVIEESDIDNAVKKLEKEGLLTKPVDPYSKLVEIYKSVEDEDPLVVQEAVNAAYFRHMGDANWDKAYSKLLDKIENGGLTENIKASFLRKKANLNEAFKESKSMSIEDILADLVDNMSDEQFESEIRRFKKIASKLGINNYAKMIMTIVEDDYDPRSTESIFEDAYVFETSMGSTYKYYPSVNMMAETHPNGLVYLYFASIVDAVKYYDTIDQFWKDFELETSTEMNYVESSIEDEEAFEEVSDGPTSINVEESLNLRDMHNNNKYDLLNKYLSEKYSIEHKSIIAKMIKESASDEEICNYMESIHGKFPSFALEDEKLFSEERVDEDSEMWSDVEKEDLKNAGILEDLKCSIDDDFTWFKYEE